MKLIISGLTAAGKTTHALLLADELSIPYYSASHIFDLLVGRPSQSARQDGRWRPEIDDFRRRTFVDRDVDERLISLLSSTSCGIFDASLLPWIRDDEPAISLWIESDAASRARKCIVSYLNDAPVTYDEAVGLLRKKDSYSEEYLFRRCGTHLALDSVLFDIALTNSHLIPEADWSSARAGIDIFREVVRMSIEYCVGRRTVAPTGPCVLWVRRPTF